MTTLLQILIYLLQTIFGFFTTMLLVRTLMRAMRISFVNQVGQFVLVTTNWAVVPFQRVLPSVGRVDLSALVPAWLLQVALLFIIGMLRWNGFAEPVSLLLHALVFGVVELVRTALYLLMFVVILDCAISWVNPHSPLGPVLRMLTRPFLAPLRKIIPPVANVDLSPVALLVIVQILLIVIS